MNGLYVLVAGLNGMIMVLMGAYGAHGLAGVDLLYHATFQTGWQIHAVHSVFLAAVALYARHNHWLHGAFWLGLVGTMFFCIPLYGPAFDWWSNGGFVTPVGGFFLLAAWFSMALAGISRMKSRAYRISDRDLTRRYYETMAHSRPREK
jgi:uncharacterized membrane protein YgdD (TMEM256/DUF423 family)